MVDRVPTIRRAIASCSAVDDDRRRLLDTFLERRATVSTEDQSPSVQRFREMIGRDEKMLIVFEWIRTAAKSDISVLILGPTGSGKEVVARMIHELSRRGRENFQAVNCAALPDTLFESEIFGYEKGAFTGAHDRKPGRVELANDGTLFLDEIGDLSLVAQAKLLRVLEDRRFERLGGQKSVQVDFRLISATNRPLEQFVRDAPVPRGPLLPRQRVLDPAAVAARAPDRHSRAGHEVRRPLLRGERHAARRQDLLRPRRSRACRRTPGRATSASWKARSRARPSPRPDGSFATPTSSSCTRHAAAGGDRRTRARLQTLAEDERDARPAGARSRWSGTRRKRRGCSRSAAARSIGRSSSTASTRVEAVPKQSHNARRARLASLDGRTQFTARADNLQFPDSLPNDSRNPSMNSAFLATRHVARTPQKCAHA